MEFKLTKKEDTKESIAIQQALDYHEFPTPGKLEIRATKPLASPRDLSRAYSPGVAEACMVIKDDPLAASRFTAKGNLVAVISNGTAALGLGDIGALASKPIMEGKAVLFKKFANIDCFDIEVDETDPVKLAEHVIALEPTFGAINLEDIKAPDCFIVEKICKERMGIPVFHDDQHGTAIVVAAAAKNALHIAGKKFEDIKVASAGGGAAGIACLNMLMLMGVKRENIWLSDRDGLVYEGRNNLTEEKAAFAQKSEAKTLEEIVAGADLFLGLSGPGVLSSKAVKTMAKKPIVFALANPTPEIMPEEVYKVVPDALVATGRSDYPNQVNNVLCFPFIFRGALDVGATQINEEMKIACVDGIAELARKTTTAETAKVYGDEDLRFGPEYLIPKPFDARLLPVVAGAVAKAAMESGVATRPLADLEQYKQKLAASAFRSSMIMRPVFEAAKTASRRIAFSEGEDERVLRAAVAMIEETVDTPILIGRPEVIKQRCEQYGLPKESTDKFEIVNPENDSRYRSYWEHYHKEMARKGVTPDLSKAILRTNTTVIGTVMVHMGEADSLICGTFGHYKWHLKYVQQLLETDKLHAVGALSAMLMDNDQLFVCDTQVNAQPTPEQIAETVISAARHVRRFGIEPNIALCSNSQFGDLKTESALRVRGAIKILKEMNLDFSFDGEMQLDAAMDPELRDRIFPNSTLKGRANVLVFSSSEIASAVKNSFKTIANGIEVGPILMGMGNRAHIVNPSITTRGLINIAALAGTPVSNYA